MNAVRAQDTRHLKGLIAHHVRHDGDRCSLNHIDVSGITDFSHVFEENKTFNGDISQWEMRSATSMRGMFRGSHFNGDISAWNTKNVQNMAFCFFKSCFGGDISRWNVSSVRTMDEMFAMNTSFFGDLSLWDVSNVESMAGMFAGTKLRDGLSNWNVGAVESMRRMFEDSDFCGDLSRWDVSGVQTFERMFEGARRFNGDVSRWNVSSAMHFGCMFSYSPFNGDISQWNFQEGANLVDMFTGNNLHTLKHESSYHWWLAATHPQLLTPPQREHFMAWTPVTNGLGLAPIAQARAIQDAWAARAQALAVDSIPRDLFAQ